MAYYPSAPPVLPSRTNLTDIVNAQDVNLAYDEIVAIANALGLYIQARQGTWSSSTQFSTSTTTTTQQRLENVENGAYWALQNAVRNTGNTSIVTPSGQDNVNLTITGANSQTASLLVLNKNTSGTITSVVSIDTNGKLVKGTIDGGVES